MKYSIRAYGFAATRQSLSGNKVSSVKYRCTYTLVEILMVIIIMALLLTVAMPAFLDMMQGEGVEAGARKMGQVLKLARSYAINNGEYVAVLMPQSDKNNHAPAGGYPKVANHHLPSQYYDRSYRVCLVQKNGANRYDFKRWLPGEKWEFLSKGVAIFESDSDKGVQFGTDGQPTNNSTCIRVDNVKLGDINSNLDNTNPADNTDDVAAIVFKPTGKSKYAGGDGGYFVEIGEGVFSGDSLIVKNHDPGSIVTVKIADYTGRVSYGDE